MQLFLLNTAYVVNWVCHELVDGDRFVTEMGEICITKLFRMNEPWDLLAELEVWQILLSFFIYSTPAWKQTLVLSS